VLKLAVLGSLLLMLVRVISWIALFLNKTDDPRNYTKSHQQKFNGNPSFDTVSAVGGIQESESTT
jgi:hypothetical protein